MSEQKEIYFDFDKFNNDLEKRQIENVVNKTEKEYVIEQDQLRRKRSELYHEKWQNNIKWSK